MMPSDSLRFVRALGWNEVFALWRDAEANLPRWIDHYKKGGFQSWDDWRRNTLRDVRYENLSWTLFDVDSPFQTVPHFSGGPFRVWIKNYYDGARTRTFEEMAKSEKVQNNTIVKEMIANFPTTTYLLGLEVDKRIFVIEGMHRCCALAVMALQKKAIQAKVLIALSSYPGEIPEMGRPDSPT